MFDIPARTKIDRWCAHAIIDNTVCIIYGVTYWDGRKIVVLLFKLVPTLVDSMHYLVPDQIEKDLCMYNLGEK